MKRICMTGFDPVTSLGDKTNPSYELIKDFPQEFMGCEVLTFEVPTAFDRHRAAVAKVIQEYKPDIFLGLGLSGSRFEITLENIGINFRDAGYMKDNDGVILHHQPIYEDGADAYKSNLPVYDIVQKAQSEGIQMAESYYCGTYCCNQTLYTALYHRDKFFPDMVAGFLHVPNFPEDVIGRKSAPSQPREKSARALELVLEVAVKILENK